jgi:hypothetical protein
MARTAELRWFLPGSFPAPLAAWFDRHAGEESERVDRYLRLSGTDALGVKLRGDGRRLEFKLRERREPAAGLPVEGWAEQWQKWSVARLPHAVLLPRLGVPARQWRDVKKRRRVAMFAWSAAGGAGLTPAAASPECGCRVELGVVEAGGQRWATLGLEAFGPDARIGEALAGCAAALFASVGPVAGLAAEASYGYPAWLERNDWF